MLKVLLNSCSHGLSESAEKETQDWSLQNGERCHKLLPRPHQCFSVEVRLLVVKA